ncbi:MAG: hypothetical protein JEZ09_19485 [Salinivirgaceae bacterium]|nr:hypothetical protein [Salinivirgaceae bacterium]
MDKIILNNEECCQIVDFERYHISESGRIYRTEIGKKRTWRTKGRVFINENKIHFRFQNDKLRQGFASLIDTDGKLHNIAVAPLVALAFGVISEKLDTKKKSIDYKDGNKKNLHYSNLLIVEKKHTNSKLNREDVKHIKKQIKLGIPLRRIAWIFGVSEMQINRIKTGENWGNGKRKIKAPVAPFEIKDGRIRKYIATFEKKKTIDGIKKPFIVKRNPSKSTDNIIVGIVNGYKLSLKHTNITRAKYIVEKLNMYFFDLKTEINILPNKRS